MRQRAALVLAALTVLTVVWPGLTGLPGASAGPVLRSVGPAASPAVPLSEATQRERTLVSGAGGVPSSAHQPLPVKAGAYACDGGDDEVLPGSPDAAGLRVSDSVQPPSGSRPGEAVAGAVLARAPPGRSIPRP